MTASASHDRRQRERAARRAEDLAAVVLTLKGYRILGKRVRTPAGELDIVACRFRRLAFVEVKQRATFADADYAVSQRQAARIWRAAESWLRQNPRYRDHRLGFDRFDVAGRFRFRHLPDALQPVT
jgi:putative endonuclease